MNATHAATELDRIRASHFYLKIVLVLVVVVTIILSFVVMRLIDSTRIIVIPPGFDRAFWVSGERVSQEYLARWSYFVTTIGMNVTPRNVEGACSILLDLATRDAGPSIKSQCDKTIEAVRKDGIRTTFDPQGELRIDEERMRVSIPGVLSTYVGERHTSDRSTTVAVWFKLDPRGRLRLDFYREVPANDPFGVKLAGARAGN